MLRLLILAALVYLLYRMLRKVLAGVGGGNPNLKTGSPSGTGPINEMIQDPVCKTYIPRADAERRFIGGREQLFCSKECAERFEREQCGRNEEN